MDGVGKIVEGVNALEAALNSNRVRKVFVLDKKSNKWKVSFNPKNIKTGKLQKSLINSSDGKVAIKQGTKINPAIAQKLFKDGLKNILIDFLFKKIYV